MVRVAGGSYSYGVIGRSRCPTSWIDRHEVSNGSSSASSMPAATRIPVLEGTFRDGDACSRSGGDGAAFATRREEGPAIWELGTYQRARTVPGGRHQLFRGAAYAEFAGRTLPPCPTGTAPRVRTGPSPTLARQQSRRAGGRESVRCRAWGPWGTTDDGGNVKEWCSNTAPAPRAASSSAAAGTSRATASASQTRRAVDAGYHLRPAARRGSRPGGRGARRTRRPGAGDPASVVPRPAATVQALRRSTSTTGLPSSARGRDRHQHADWRMERSVSKRSTAASACRA